MTRTPCSLLFALLPMACCLTLASAAGGEGNWPQFRGPGGRGVAPEGSRAPPVHWSATENIDWKHDIPGRGWSSPVVWDGRVFLTTVVNQGETEKPKKGLYFGGNRPAPPESPHRWIVFCLDLMTGQVLWERQVHEGRPQTSIHLKNSFASETPITNGRRLYVLFGGLGVFCFDLDGNAIWSYPMEPRKTRYGWGTAASPVLHQGRLYVVNDNEEASYLVALDAESGEKVWQVDRDEKSNWATPFVWQTAERVELVAPGSGKVRAYDLEGNLLWWLTGMSSITIATPYEYDGLLYVSSGYVLDRQRPLYAIRPGGEGDLSLADGETSGASIAWCQPQGGPYNPSTVAYDGIIYVLYDQGFMAAYDASDGNVVYSKKRIPNGRAFTSSPWVSQGRVFCLNEDGVTFVIKAGDTFEILGTNPLAEDDMSMATPAISGDRLLIRTSERLYCVRQPE